MPHVIQRAAASNDLLEHFVYLAEKAGLDAADRLTLTKMG
jgi:toxin ParE1/3/4